MNTIQDYIAELSKFVEGEDNWPVLLNEYESHLQAEYEEFLSKNPVSRSEKAFVMTLERPEVLYISLIGKKSMFTSHETNQIPTGRLALSYLCSIFFMSFLTWLGSIFSDYIPSSYYNYSYQINPFLTLFWPLSLIPTNGVRLNNYFAFFTLSFFILLFLLFDKEFLSELKWKKIILNQKFKIASKLFLIYIFIGCILTITSISLNYFLNGNGIYDPFYDFSPVLLWIVFIPFLFHWISIVFALISGILLFLFYRYDILKFRTDVKRIKVTYLTEIDYNPTLKLLGNFLFAYGMGAIAFFYSIYFMNYTTGHTAFIANLPFTLSDSILWPNTVISIVTQDNFQFYSIQLLTGYYSNIFYSFLYALLAFVFFILFPITKLLKLYTKQTSSNNFNKVKEIVGEASIIYILCAIFNFIINISLVTWNGIRLFGYYSDGYDYDLVKETFLWMYYSLPPISADWFSHLPALLLFISLIAIHVVYKYFKTNSNLNPINKNF